MIYSFVKDTSEQQIYFTPTIDIDIPVCRTIALSG